MRCKVVTGILAILMMGFAASADAMTDIEKLGGMIYRDTDLSTNANQSCMTCHHPTAGYADPVNRRDPYNFPVSEGSVPGSFGGRNAPSAAYAGFNPIFSWDPDKGGHVGGMFWDGRATGEELGIPTNPQVYDLAGGAPPDLGLGGRLGEADQNGKFKVPTLRNVAKSAPYGHNGYFPTLAMIVNFYNLRDAPGSPWYDLLPEVPETVNRTEMADLGLSAREELWIVAFLHTLTDGPLTR